MPYTKIMMVLVKEISFDYIEETENDCAEKKRMVIFKRKVTMDICARSLLVF